MMNRRLFSHRSFARSLGTFVGFLALLGATGACSSGSSDGAPSSATSGSGGRIAMTAAGGTANGGTASGGAASLGAAGTLSVAGSNGSGGSSGSGGSVGGSANGGAGGGTLGPSSGYEAELGFFSGGVTLSSATPGYTGTSYVTNFTTTGAQVIFTVNLKIKGDYTVSLRYASNAPASLTTYVNGYQGSRITLPAGSGTSPWLTAKQTLSLRAGLNTVTYRREAADSGSPDVDALLVENGLTLAARGATLPYVEMEAETATQTGAVVGPSRDYGQLPAEASARKAVTLSATGHEVAFTLSAPANAMTVRYSMPDSADGAGLNATLGVYAGDTHLQDMPVSSKYAWIYGPYLSNGEPAQNDPSQGTPHHYFDEQRVLIGNQAAGTVIELRKDAASMAANYTIDLVDFEQVDAPLGAPANFVSITSKGAIPDDGQDDTAALNDAISAAQAADQGVFIPAGTFEINSRINLQGVTLAGAGQWYSVLHGKAGKGGLFGLGGRIEVLDLAIFGDVSNRNDGGSDAGIEGNFADGSLIQNVWIEHTKVGMWFDAPTTGLYVVGNRIRDTFADGVNLHKGTAFTRVDQMTIRNTGDDSLAMFSEAQAVTSSAFTFNTVQLPLLANAIGIYGGTDNRAEDNLLSDTVNASAGIAIGTRFAPVNFSGTQSIQRNTLLRTGGYEHNWMSALGALWIYADTADITAPILIKDLDIEDSAYQGILMSFQKTISGVTFETVKIDGATTYGIDIEANGSATFNAVTVSNAAQGGLNNPSGYALTRGTGDSGF
jgi:Pectate lyase superfamily protein/Carbohydrate binding module (family 35)